MQKISAKIGQLRFAPLIRVSTERQAKEAKALITRGNSFRLQLKTSGGPFTIGMRARSVPPQTRNGKS